MKNYIGYLASTNEWATPAVIFITGEELLTLCGACLAAYEELALAPSKLGKYQVEFTCHINMWDYEIVGDELFDTIYDELDMEEEGDFVLVEGNPPVGIVGTGDEYLSLPRGFAYIDVDSEFLILQSKYDGELSCSFPYREILKELSSE